METLTNSATMDLQNPHEEFLTDEATGLPVPSQRYEDWQAGHKVGYQVGYSAGLLRAAGKMNEFILAQRNHG